MSYLFSCTWICADVWISYSHVAGYLMPTSLCQLLSVTDFSS
uniref:Uncharacterized protein n=1 Tax=Setaria italica TaxID=4555 RepID=K3ZPU9_SETIT